LQAETVSHVAADTDSLNATAAESQQFDAPQDEEAATIVNPSHASSFKESSERRRFPIALVLGSFTLAALLVALLYAWRGGTTNRVADANTNNAPSPIATPGVQAATTPSPSPPAASGSPSPQPSVAVESSVAPDKERAALRSTVDSWLAAHNTRNLSQVTNFYMPHVSAFYRAQNTSRAAVRAEKARLFQESAMSIKRTSEPQITIAQDGSTATMTFRKSYSRGTAAKLESGEVLQEIVWQKTNRGWKIISERDLRVLR
jgi:ketosteroid isomerase-like protein